MRRLFIAACMAVVPASLPLSHFDGSSLGANAVQMQARLLHQQAQSPPTRSQMLNTGLGPDWWLVYVTEALVLVTAVQLGLFYWQLRLIRSSVIDCAELARNASAETKLARQAFIHTQRPIIRVRNVRFREGHPQSNTILEGEFDLVNVGGTTARIISCDCRTMLGPESLYPRWAENSANPRSAEGLPVLDPGVHTSLPWTTERPLTDRQCQAIVAVASNFRFYVFGRITYLDDLDISRTTGFCRRWGEFQGRGGVALFEKFPSQDWEYED